MADVEDRVAIVSVPIHSRIVHRLDLSCTLSTAAAVAAAAEDTTQVRMHVVETVVAAAVVVQDRSQSVYGQRRKATELDSRMQTSADSVGVDDGDCVTLVLRMLAYAPTLAASVRKLSSHV